MAGSFYGTSPQGFLSQQVCIHPRKVQWMAPTFFFFFAFSQLFLVWVCLRALVAEVAGYFAKIRAAGGSVLAPAVLRARYGTVCPSPSALSARGDIRVWADP